MPEPKRDGVVPGGKFNSEVDVLMGEIAGSRRLQVEESGGMAEEAQKLGGEIRIIDGILVSNDTDKKL